MLVGEVRCATFGSGTSWKLSGGRPWSSTPMKVSNHPQVLRATARRKARSSAPRARRGATRLRPWAMNGATAQSPRTGAAAQSADGRKAMTTRSPAPAMTGLAAISTQNGRAPAPPGPAAPRAALAAAVSHSSSLRRVNTSRTRVIWMACSISWAWLARKASWSRTRASPPPASSRSPRRKARHGCCGVGPAMASNASGRSGKAVARTTSTVQTAGLPGRIVHAASRRATVAGASRLRRRLSRIFHRERMGRWLRCSPLRVGTKGKSQARICQSPRAHRCCRRAWVRTLEG